MCSHALMSFHVCCNLDECIYIIVSGCDIIYWLFAVITFVNYLDLDTLASYRLDTDTCRGHDNCCLAMPAGVPCSYQIAGDSSRSVVD